jgi:pimeloyl-ACP methyl ester carboxylesterase
MLDYPERVKNGILIATHFGGENRIAPDFNDTAKLMPVPDLSLTENIKRSLSVLYSKNFLDKYEEVLTNFVLEQKDKNFVPPYVLLNQHDASRMFVSEHRLNEIENPVLILQGSEDKIVMPENAKLLENKIKNSKAVIFQGIGHTVPAEIPEQCVNEIKDFVLG